jgi:hypothetical protein
MMIENISTVDHFPDVLKHFSHERLLSLSAHYEQLLSDSSPDNFLYDRAARCQQEIARRGALIPWLRRLQWRRVA